MTSKDFPSVRTTTPLQVTLELRVSKFDICLITESESHLKTELCFVITVTIGEYSIEKC